MPPVCGKVSTLFTVVLIGTRTGFLKPASLSRDLRLRQQARETLGRLRRKFHLAAAAPVYPTVFNGILAAQESLEHAANI